MGQETKPCTENHGNSVLAWAIFQRKDVLDRVQLKPSPGTDQRLRNNLERVTLSSELDHRSSSCLLQKKNMNHKHPLKQTKHPLKHPLKHP